MDNPRGRHASAEDLARLGGPNSHSQWVSKGLVPCLVCHEYYGECLGASSMPTATTLRMTTDGTCPGSRPEPSMHRWGPRHILRAHCDSLVKQIARQQQIANTIQRRHQ